MFDFLWSWFTGRKRVRLLCSHSRKLGNSPGVVSAHKLELAYRDVWLPVAPQAGEHYADSLRGQPFMVLATVQTHTKSVCLVEPQFPVAFTERLLTLEARGFRKLPDAEINDDLRALFYALLSGLTKQSLPIPTGQPVSNTLPVVLPSPPNYALEPAPTIVRTPMLGPNTTLGPAHTPWTPNPGQGRADGVVFGQNTLTLDGQVNGRNVSIPVQTNHRGEPELPGKRIDPMPMSGQAPMKPFGSQ